MGVLRQTSLGGQRALAAPRGRAAGPKSAPRALGLPSSACEPNARRLGRAAVSAHGRAAAATTAASRTTLSFSPLSTPQPSILCAALASSALRRADALAARAAAPRAAAAAALAEPPAPPAPGGAPAPRADVRNIAIIAHVDHGKTTLVDAMLRQAKVFRANQALTERVMDSNDLERERGITILSKNTAITWGGAKINVIDTPGHADFGGEVERVLNMADGVLLLVDSVEGPMPQTRFVLRKALAAKKRVVVVVNKVDKPAARCDFVLDAAFDLFCELGATDEQCDFPTVYASGARGVAGMDPSALADDLSPLFETILREVPAPTVDLAAPVRMQVCALDFDEHKGRIAIGRVERGTLRKGMTVTIANGPDLAPRQAKVTELFVFDNFQRSPAEEVLAGDICAVTGLGDASIGDTLCDPSAVEPLETIAVEEPTVRMTFSVNTSPFAGREGKFVTSRNLKERLERELERNLALRVEPGTGAESFEVSGRGSLHLGILMETMRREGYEFAVGPPKVITRRDADGTRLEPMEEAVVEVPEEHIGAVTGLMGSRRAAMLDMGAGSDGSSRVVYRLPTRAMLGLRNALLTATKGTAVLSSIVVGHEPWCGDLAVRENGSLVAFEEGQVTAYALESAQARGRMFVAPGDEVYEGQVIGIHQRQGDLKINVCKKKAMTNIRAAGKDTQAVLTEPVAITLDYALEYIADDELVEVTPVSSRLRKNPTMKKRGGK
jgi:GTP-binding protein